MKRGAPIDAAISGSPCIRILDEIRSTRKEWADLEKAFEASAFKLAGADTYLLDPFALQRALSRIASPALASQLDAEVVKEAEAWASEAAQVARSNFDDELRQFCTRANVEFSGREPLYRIGGFLQVRLAVEKGMSIVGSKKVASLLASRVWSEVQSELEEEQSRGGSPAQFLGWSYQAYRTVISRKNEVSGSAIPIKELYQMLASMVSQQKLPLLPKRRSRAQYTVRYFERDLSRITATANLTTDDGFKMNLMPTSFSKEGVSVVLGDGVRIVGRVSFSEARK